MPTCQTTQRNIPEYRNLSALVNTVIIILIMVHFLFGTHIDFVRIDLHVRNSSSISLLSLF
jgi:hypothetical protein